MVRWIGLVLMTPKTYDNQRYTDKKTDIINRVQCKARQYRVILINQSISVSSQTQFFEIVSSKSVVKSSFGRLFVDEWNNLP